jgi:hypothetical protein
MSFERYLVSRIHATQVVQHNILYVQPLRTGRNSGLASLWLDRRTLGEWCRDDRLWTGQSAFCGRRYVLISVAIRLASVPACVHPRFARYAAKGWIA